MESGNRAIDDRPSLRSFAERAMRGPDATQLEMEKAQVDQEIIIKAETARRGDLTAEVTRELAMRRASRMGMEMSLPGFGHRSTSPTAQSQLPHWMHEIPGTEVMPAQEPTEPKLILLGRPDSDLFEAKHKAAAQTTVSAVWLHLLGSTKKPKDEWSCALCRVSATSEKHLNEHLQSKKHKAKAVGLKARHMAKKAHRVDLTKSRRRRKCLFNIGPFTKAVMETHIAGERHKALPLKQSHSAKTVPTTTNTTKTNAVGLWPAHGAGGLHLLDSKKKPGEEWSSGVCRVAATSKKDLNKHLQGKEHKGKEAGLRPENMAENAPVPKASKLTESKQVDEAEAAIAPECTKKKKDKFWCEICDIGTSAEVAMEAHKLGKKPKAGLQEQSPTAKTLPTTKPTSIATNAATDIITTTAAVALHIDGTRGLHLLDSKKKTREEWSCAVCGVAATSEKSLNAHLGGKKHKAKEAGLITEKAPKVDLTKSDKKASKLTESKQVDETEAERTPACSEKRKSRFWGEICDIGTLTEAVMERQKQEKKHKSQLQEQIHTARNAPTTRPTSIPSTATTNTTAAAVAMPPPVVCAGRLHLLGSKTKPNEEWSCAVCRVAATSKKDLNKHLQGKKHKSNKAGLRPKNMAEKALVPKASKLTESKQVDEAEAAIAPECTKKKKDKFWCEICDIGTSAEVAMEAHKLGKKPKAGLQEQSSSAKTLPTTKPTSIATNAATDTITATAAVAHIDGTGGLHLLDSKKKTREEWSCAVCAVAATSEKSLNEHLGGKKHKAKEAGLITEKAPKVDLTKSDKKASKLTESKQVDETEAEITPACSEKRKYKFWCEICDIGTLTEAVMESQKQEKKHKTQLQEQIRSARNAPTARPTSIPSTTTTNTTAVAVAMPPPPVGAGGLHLLGSKKKANEGLSCALCEAAASSEKNLNEHLQDKQHKSREASLNIENMAKNAPDVGFSKRNGKTPKLTDAKQAKEADDGATAECTNERKFKFWCEICEVESFSEVVMEAHILGKKHKALLQEKINRKRTASTTKPTSIASVATTSNTIAAAPPPEDGPGGLHLLDSKKQPEEEWSNSLCEVAATSENSLNEHLLSKKHKAKEAGFKAKNMANHSPDLGSTKSGKKASKLSESKRVDEAEADIAPECMEKRRYEFWCEICGIGTFAEIVMEAHKLGKKHKARVQGKIDGTKTTTTMTPKSIASPSNTGTRTALSTAAMTMLSPEPRQEAKVEDATFKEESVEDAGFKEERMEDTIKEEVEEADNLEVKEEKREDVAVAEDSLWRKWTQKIWWWKKTN